MKIANFFEGGNTLGPSTKWIVYRGYLLFDELYRSREIWSSSRALLTNTSANNTYVDVKLSKILFKIYTINLSRAIGMLGVAYNQGESSPADIQCHMIVAVCSRFVPATGYLSQRQRL